MGYQMPIVCKDIYIPLACSVDESLTLEQYKEKYGIDLREIFKIVVNESNVTIEFPSLAKVYIIDVEGLAGGSRGCVYLTHFAITNGVLNGFECTFTCYNVDTKFNIGLKFGLEDDQIVLTPYATNF